MIKFELKLTLFLITLGLLCSLCNCLFEDQAGTYDWRQQYVGKALYSQIDSNLNRVYLATDQNVLAALNMKTGNIVWRKVFESNENGKIDLALWAAKEAVLVTGNGLRIQGFSYNLGFANWEYNLFAPQSKRTNIVGIESKQENEVYYFTNGYQLCYVSRKDKVCVELPLDGGYVYENLIETELGVYAFGIKNNQVQKLHYNQQLTSLLSKSQSTGDSTIYESCIKSSDSNELVLYSSQQNKISFSLVKSSNNQFELKGQQLSSNSLFDSLQVNLVFASKSTLLFSSVLNDDRDNHSKMRLFLINRENFSLIKKLDSINNYDIVEKSSNDIYLVYSNYLGLNKLNFNVLNLKNGQERSDLAVTINSAEKDYKSIIHMKAKLIESRNNQPTLNTLCFFNDYSLSLFNEQGLSYFTREEALAYITSVEMIDFPLLHLQEEFEDEFGHSEKDNVLKMFYKRIRTQLIQLREFITIDLNQKLMNYLNNGNFKSRSTGTGNNNALSAEEITRDEFNLNKLMVVGTSVGKVFGLYTGDNGRILWSFYIKNLKPFRLNKIKQEVYMPLFLQRTAAHFPFDPQCVLIGRTNDLKTKILFFNPITGSPAKDHPREGYLVDYQVRLAFLSTQPDSQFLKPLFLFDNQNRLHVLPEKSINDLEIKSQSKPAVLFSTVNDAENRTNILAGYALKFDNKELPEVWRINLEDEQIAAIASKLPNDRIHSHGKVLGDRSVLYKYLNPNLVGVVTTGQDSQKVPFINLYLVDTVTGSVIYSLNYKRCKGPVHIVHSENWFFFSYYNIKFRRNEVTSIELFEGSTQFNSTHFSSLDDIKPVVYTKSYIVQKSFDAMQVTLTEKGISTKDIIVACQYGVIIEIPWILIDPRRPLKMTEIEREENLLPYMPEIPLNYEFSLNYYNYVYNIRGITTSPSGLESTSLVFCYGLDIFFTRVFPSKTFDMLREDFDYFFITTLMVGLILGTVLSKKLASSSNLKKAWK